MNYCNDQEQQATGYRKTTVIFLLYTEADYVHGLFRSISAQQHPLRIPQSEWLDVLFIDNGSADNTYQELLTAWEKIGAPPNYTLIRHPLNLGIGGALNDAFQRIRTPFALTCHCDVLFASDDYVSRLSDLLASHPRAGAIAGQPAVPPKTTIPFPEKINLITNLMDILPAEENSAPLIPVGFVEGRCEIFRLDALRAAGFYDLTLRLAGEDQVLAARMRDAGFELYQCTSLRYYLSVSSDQNSLWKIARHQRLFGRAHPYILFRHRNATAGITGVAAGKNRRLRTGLRVLQLISAAVYLLTILALLYRVSPSTIVALLSTVFIAKLAIFSRHIAAVPLSPIQFVAFFLLQPVFDLNYSCGLIHGIWLATRGSPSEQIR